MTGHVIDFTLGDGREMTGYLAVPDAGNGPGVVLVVENGDDNPDARRLTDLYAAEGYAALCTPAAPSHDDVAAAIAALRSRTECTGKVAAIGFGPGAISALRAAADKRVECAICYSPPTVEEALILAPRIDCPVALHLAGSDPATPPAAVEKLKQAFAGRPEVSVYVYPGTARGFELRRDGQSENAAAGLAHSRSIAVLRRVMGPHYDLEGLWEAHTRYEFETRDVDATMATMVDEPYVNHVPVMTGGVGQRDLARFYANHFIPTCPADIAMVPVSRTIGADRVVDEMVVSFTHDREIDWMLPGVAPTGRRVEVPLVAIVGFRGDKLYHEHIYWDQASVLVQIGLLDPNRLPVAGVETARKFLDETLPSNTLMSRWADSAPKILR